MAMIRLLKPQSYYTEKYGTRRYGLDKLYLLMEKQHNRGQEGAGIACVNMLAPDGEEYMLRERAEGKDAITKVFNSPQFDPLSLQLVGLPEQELPPRGRTPSPWERGGERSQSSIFNFQLLMGHLRYSTTGKHGIQYVHPFLRRNNWRVKNLCLCGNFNMTNMGEVFRLLTEQGQSPRIKGDAYIALELMGHRLDREVERLYREAKERGLEGRDITAHIEDHVDMAAVLRSSMRLYDGGYVMCGMTGSGEMFTIRDPWGIRPAFYYKDEEVFVLASERPVIQTSFDLAASDIHELKPGEGIIVRKNGNIRHEQILPPQQRASCSFERIYFSRGSDCDIYQERKRLGCALIPDVMRAIGGDTEHTVFSFIPNTAEVAFYGLTDGLRQRGLPVRTEKVVWKDIKLRTFISEAGERNDLAAHVYDVSYGSIKPYEDNLVIIDDSIVRGTTLKESIFKILDRLHPKKIVMVSSAPQIRYPDYYGIDMSRLEELCAFRAAISLLKERGMQHVIDEVYELCNEELRMKNEESSILRSNLLACQSKFRSAPEHLLERKNPQSPMTPVRKIYEPFTVDELNRKIVEMLQPEGMQAPVELVFQSIEGLHNALTPSRSNLLALLAKKERGGERSQLHYGDWYFTGNYPTPGGIRLVNQAFVEYYERNIKD